MKNSHQDQPKKLLNKAARKRFWEQVVLDQKASGLKIHDFCKQRELSIAAFTYWKYRGSKNGTKSEQKIITEENKDLNFIQLRVEKNGLTCDHESRSESHEKNEITIIFKNGHAINLPLVISEKILLCVIDELASLPC